MLEQIQQTTDSENERNSAKLLDRDDILKISYSGRRAGFQMYASLSLALESEICTRDNRLYVQNDLSLEYGSYLATLLSYARFRVYIYRLGNRYIHTCTVGCDCSRLSEESQHLEVNCEVILYQPVSSLKIVIKIVFYFKLQIL